MTCEISAEMFSDIGRKFSCRITCFSSVCHVCRVLMLPAHCKWLHNSLATLDASSCVALVKTFSLLVTCRKPCDVNAPNSFCLWQMAAPILIGCKFPCRCFHIQRKKELCCGCISFGVLIPLTLDTARRFNHTVG